MATDATTPRNPMAEDLTDEDVARLLAEHPYRTALADHPGYWFTAAGPHYRLHHGEDFLGTFAHWEFLLAEVTEHEAAQ